MNPVDNSFPGQSRDEDQIGYGNPPKSGQFQKGVSGNPRGRPRGSLNMATVLSKALREKVLVHEKGRRKLLSKFEIALRQLVNKAAAGDLRAIRQLADLNREAESKQAFAGTPAQSTGELDQQVIASILKRFRGTPGTGGEEGK
jgi:hypothetical protein